jgi:hypothetical protein
MENRIKTSPGRREFLGAAAAALFAGITITLVGCGDDDAGTGATAETGDLIGSISDNHGHKAILKKATFEAGGAVTLDIQGSAGHNHTVSLTADDMAELKKPGGMVTKASSTTDSHNHEVMFM